MAPEEIQDLVQDFTAKATAVNAVVQELPNMAAALQYVVDVCENKAPCELMADEDVEKGPNGPNGVPTRVQRIVAAPVLNDEDFATLEAACKEKGFLCIREGLRNHLAGIDVGLTFRDGRVFQCHLPGEHRQRRCPSGRYDQRDPRAGAGQVQAGAHPARDRRSHA